MRASGTLTVPLPAVQPGKPEELRFMSTYINNNAANAYFEWHRPRDAPGNGYPSCVSEYRIEVLAVSAGGGVSVN